VYLGFIFMRGRLWVTGSGGVKRAIYHNRNN
jgi:hypothetical protein